MTINAYDIAFRVATLLNDTSSVRWTAPELVAWMNDGAKAIVANAPDANSVTMEITLAAGVKQSLSAIAELSALTPYQLLEITRNTALTSSGGVVRQVTRTILDAQVPNWPTATASVDVVHFIYDPRVPYAFYVYPPATALAKVEATVALLPADVAVPSGTLWSAITGSVGINQVYVSALVDYICYRAFMKDATVEGTVSRAMAYYKSFADAVGLVEAGTKPPAPVVSTATGQE